MVKGKEISVTRRELSEALDLLDDAKKALYTSKYERAVEILNEIDSQLNKLLSGNNVVDLDSFITSQRERLLEA